MNHCFNNVNSGKFGQRPTLPKHEYFTDPKKYFAVVTDAGNEILGAWIVNSHMVALSYRKVDDFVEDLPNTNTMIAAWVTAQARCAKERYTTKLKFLSFE